MISRRTSAPSRLINNAAARDTRCRYTHTHTHTHMHAGRLTGETFSRSCINFPFRARATVFLIRFKHSAWLRPSFFPVFLLFARVARSYAALPRASFFNSSEKTPKFSSPLIRFFLLPLPPSPHIQRFRWGYFCSARITCYTGGSSEFLYLVFYISRSTHISRDP